MTELLLDRGPAPAPPLPGTGWLRRRFPGRSDRAAPPPAPVRPPAEDADTVRAVLEAAVEVVRRGWVQGAFFLVRTRRGRVRPVGPLDFTVSRSAEVTGACLVGAIVAAGRSRNPGAYGPDHYPALDRAWSALAEVAPGSVRAGQARRPDVLACRVRDLTAWNDAPGRTRAEVEHLLDVAISATILDAVTAGPGTSTNAPVTRR